VAALTDVVPLGWLVTLLLLTAGLVAAAWYWFPAWVPRRLPRWRLPRLRRPRRPFRRRRRAGESRPTGAPAEPAPADGLPDLPAEIFASLADRLAAEGRYAEAVRERLRAMVRELVERRVIEHRPGWTVGELAAEAGRARPAIDPPLRSATDVFSELWYGQRPARPEHDARMRGHAADLHAALESDRATGRTAGRSRVSAGGTP
jgi:hypothetical protein